MAETSGKDQTEVLDPENGDGAKALNVSGKSKKDLPERGSWSSKLDFILSVVS